MPPFFDKHENAEIFRGWYADVAEFCSRTPEMQNTEAVFKGIRNLPNVIEGSDEIWILFVHVENPIDVEEGSVCNGLWDQILSNKELFHAVKFVLKDKCHDIVESVLRGGNG